MNYQKRIFKALLLSMLTAGGTCAASGLATYSNKTFLSQRPHGVNTAMEYTTWHQHAYKKHAPTIHSHFQAAPFYQASQRSGDLGKYFGIGNGKNSFIVGNQNQVNNDTADIVNLLIIHDSDAANPLNPPDTLAGTISFNPEQEAYGMRLDWFQHVEHPSHNLFFKVSAPIVHVENNMKINIANSANSAISSFSLNNFFMGNVKVPQNAAADETDLQNPLTSAKINGRRSKCGLADIDLGFGYKYYQTENRHVFFSLDVTIPTGNRVRGEYLFEPVYGNGRHFGLGGSVDTGFTLWESDKANIRLLWALRYKYLFENVESRTLSVNSIRFSQYFLVGDSTQPIGTPLQPAANVLTMPLAVKPGSQFDSMADLAFHCCNFTIDLGYNFFWKDRETVHIKSFQNNRYGIAAAGFDTSAGAFTAANTLNGAPLLTTANLDIDAATTPSLFTSKIFAGLGYSSRFYKDYLISGGIGGSYEFATSNADLENYAFWGKVNFSF